jgi:hypothetical protein
MLTRGVATAVLAVLALPITAFADLTLDSEFDIDAPDLGTVWIAQHDLDPSLEFVDASGGQWQVIDLDTGTVQAVLPVACSLIRAALVIPDSDRDGLDEIVAESSAGLLLIEGTNVTERQTYSWPAGEKLWGQCDGDPAAELLLQEGLQRLIVVDVVTAEIEGSYQFADEFRIRKFGDLDGDGLNEILISCFVCGQQTRTRWYVFDTNGVAASADDDFGAIPPAMRLQLTAPEPTSSDVRIDFALVESEPVSIRIIDVTGRLVQAVAEDLPFQAGQHRMTWDGTDRDGHDAPSGVYFVQVATKERTDSRRITLVR